MNGIERDLDGQAQVIRLDLSSSLGREIASRHDIRSVPTLLVFNGDGDVAFRYSGIPNRKEIVSQARALL